MLEAHVTLWLISQCVCVSAAAETQGEGGDHEEEGGDEGGAEAEWGWKRPETLLDNFQLDECCYYCPNVFQTCSFYQFQKYLIFSVNWYSFSV